MRIKNWTILTILVALVLALALTVSACAEGTSDTTAVTAAPGATDTTEGTDTTDGLDATTTSVAGGGEDTTTSLAEGEDTTTTLVAGETTTTVAGDTTTTLVGGETSTTVAGDTTTTLVGGETSTTVAGGPTTSLPDLSGQSLEVAAVWTSTEQENFRAVLDAFAQQTGAQVTFTSTGNDIATVIGTRIQGNNPPDVAMLPQPGLMQSLIQQNALQPIEDVVGTQLSANYAPVFRDLGTVDGTLYGFVFKAANKSTVWYSKAAFDNAGVQPPQTWDELLAAADTLSASGVTPFSIAGADGWTLTDWFENVYLQTAGPEMYDQLARHEIPWTDDSVRTALEILAQIFGNEGWVAGGNDGALQITFPQSVVQVFGDPQRAAMVYEGDFVAGVIAGETQAKLGTDADFFPFPMIGGAPGGTTTTVTGETTTTAVDGATTTTELGGTTTSAVDGATTTTAAGGETATSVTGGITGTTMAGETTTTMAGETTTTMADETTTTMILETTTTMLSDTTTTTGTTTGTTQAGEAGGGSVVVGGDTAVMMKDSEGARALMQFLATPEAAQIWVEKGGFTSPNQNVDPNAYPDPILARAAQDLANASQVRFDMSDQAPPAFGATPAQGMWKLLQDFLQNPDNIDQIMQQLEQAAASAYGQ